jgi:hypothetical protein
MASSRATARIGRTLDPSGRVRRIPKSRIPGVLPLRAQNSGW